MGFSKSACALEDTPRTGKPPEAAILACISQHFFKREQREKLGIQDVLILQWLPFRGDEGELQEPGDAEECLNGLQPGLT